MLNKIVKRMLSMNDDAWYIFKRSLQLCAMLLLGAVMLLIGGEGREMYLTAMALYELVPVLLLIAIIGSVCIEDMACR